jgi:glycosyltransferase involved in cell wall biosynthesis
MRIIYLIPAYNEEDSLQDLAATLSTQLTRFPQLRTYIIDNASTDGSQSILEGLEIQYPWLQGLFIKEKGLGIAFQNGMRELMKLNLTSEDWIIFSAADLPFEFSDLEAFLKLKKDHPDCALFVGSKSHPASQIQRSLKRSIASWVFQILRGIFLKMHTKDPQGTLFLRADYVNFVEKITSRDYFFSTELVYFMEKTCRVIEMPVILKPDRRPSKVNLIIDGLKVLKQILRLRLRASKNF